ncbi:MAG TPA: hypothetical protein VHX38_33755 [Pseudonocardiaceae bacterium]|jgi:hypothetical protein|nr:hypothetical protein [Pseudonocardiaceae bacterium]
MTRIRAGAVAVLVAVGMLSGGCGLGSSAPPDQHAVPAGTSSGERTTPATTTTATPTTTTAPVPATAADGTNLGACTAGNCEVQVSDGTSIPLSASLGVGPVTVTGIQPDTVSITMAVSAGQVTSDCTGDPSCVADLQSSLDGGAGSTTVQATGHVGAMCIVNQLTVTVVAVGPGPAILRLSTS